MARSMVATASSCTCTKTSDAPRVRAATAAPSRTRWGSWWTSSRSLPLAGSPSAPLATTTGPLNRVGRRERHLAASGNQAPPWPRTPLRSSSSRNDDPGQAGRAPHWVRWSRSVTVRPSAPTPASSRSGPAGGGTSGGLGRARRPDERVSSGAISGTRRARRAVPVAVPDRAPVFWSTCSASVRVIGVGEERSAVTVPPLSEVTTPRVEPRVTEPEDMATPPPWAALPTSVDRQRGGRGVLEVHGQDHLHLALAVGLEVDWEPARPTVKGGVGAVPVGRSGRGGRVVVGAVGAPAAEAVPAFFLASWASRAVEVPARWDHPGRSGPRAAKTTRARATTTVPTPAAARWPAVKVRPVARRHTTTEMTAAEHAASRARTTGSGGVGAAAQRVEQGDGPAQVGQPVDEPPRGEPDPVAEGAGDQHGQQQVEGERPEPHVQRPVGGPEGDEGVGEPDGDVAVADRGDHVDGHEAHAEQGEVPVDVLGQEPGPALGGPPRPRPPRPRTTVAVRRSRATRPVERVRYQRALPLDAVPSSSHGRRHRGAGSGRGPPPWSDGQPAAVTVRPSVRTRRAGRPTRSSQVTAPTPLTMAAVEAVLASTQDPAATDTVLQYGSTGSPVSGSTRWWTSWPPSSQCRRPMPEVASPPASMLTCTVVVRSPQTSAMPDGEAPSGAFRTAMSPPSETRVPHPSWSAMAAHGPVGGPGLGRGPEVEHRAGQQADGPALGVHHHRLPAGHRPRRREPPGHPLGQGREVAVVAEGAEGRAHGGVDGSVAQRCGPHGQGHRLEQVVGDRVGPTGRVGRGRVQAR